MADVLALFGPLRNTLKPLRCSDPASSAAARSCIAAILDRHSASGACLVSDCFGVHMWHAVQQYILTGGKEFRLADVLPRIMSG
jgi:hypothetical protein